MGIPLGWLADRWHRVRLITLGLIVWSGLTTLSGMARGFWSLFAVRVGVGIGESSCAPAGQTILSDYFPRAKRSTILAAFNCGVPIGHGLGLYLGGFIAQHWGWRWAFYLLGIPGLLLALVVMNLKEPVRGQMDESPQPEATVVSRGAVKKLWAAIRAKPALQWHLAGMAMIGFAVNGLAVWLPTFLVRVRGMSVEAAGEISGLSAIIAGLLGAFLGGLSLWHALHRRAGVTDPPDRHREFGEFTVVRPGLGSRSRSGRTRDSLYGSGGVCTGDQPGGRCFSHSRWQAH
jgi:MFS family permease